MYESYESKDDGSREFELVSGSKSQIGHDRPEFCDYLIRSNVTRAYSLSARSLLIWSL